MANASLREYVDLMVEAALDEKLQGGFDLRHFKQLKGEEALLHAKLNLKELGCGIGRCAFALSTGKILKVASDAYGLSMGNPNDQNEGEVETFKKFGRDYTPQIFDMAPDYTWIIVEPVRTFSSDADFFAKTGISYQALKMFQSYGKRMNDPSFTPAQHWNAVMQSQKQYAQYWQTLKPMGHEMIEKLRVLAYQGGLGDIFRYDHWGWASDRRIVCVDAGQ